MRMCPNLVVVKNSKLILAILGVDEDVQEQELSVLLVGL